MKNKPTEITFTPSRHHAFRVGDLITLSPPKRNVINRFFRWLFRIKEKPRRVSSVSSTTITIV